MIESSPNAFRCFIFGICSAFVSIFYSVYSYLLEAKIIGGFKYYPLGFKYAGRSAIVTPIFTIFSTSNFFIYLIVLAVIFILLMIYYLIKSYQKSESSFLAACGIFSACFAIANICNCFVYYVNVTWLYLINKV